MSWKLILGVAFMAGAFSAMAQESVATKQMSPEENLEKARDYIEKQGDFFSAMPYLRPAADAGIVRAQVWLAEFLDYGEENAEAEKYFSMAVATGDPRAKMGLAVMHIAKDVAKPDVAEARRLITEAAEDEYVPAIKALAAAYISGGLGINEEERSSTVARGWIERAADEGDVMALRKLEESYRVGGLGLAIDVAKADELKAKINKITGVVEKEDSGRRRRKQ